MPFGFSFGKKPVVPTGPPLTAKEQARQADEKRQLDSVIAVKNVLSGESDKSITAISNEVFARLKNSKPERSNEFKKLHDKLAAVDLGAAFHFLYTVKGKDGPAPVPIMPAPVVGTAAPASAPVVGTAAPASAPVVGTAAPAPASGSAQPAPAAYTSVGYLYPQQQSFTAVGPMQGFQAQAFRGVTSARRGILGFGGGAHTRRNLRKRKSRTIPSVGRDTSTGIRASGTNKATRRR